MITLSFGRSDERLLEAMRAKAPKVRAFVREELDRLMLELQRLIMAKLSGVVLEHRTGKLLGSIHKEPTVEVGDTVTGRVTGAGGPAFYGRVQELGGTRTYDILPVNKLALAFFPGGASGGAGNFAALYLGSRSAMTSLRFAQGSQRGSLRPTAIAEFSGAGGIVVRKVVHPPLPARPFMSTSLEEMREAIIVRLRIAVGKAIA
jgi:hypothetical protein